MVTAGDLLYTNFAKIDAQDTVASFIGVIKKKDATFALIFDGKQYLGFADKKELLRSRFDPAKTKIRHALKHVPLLSSSSKLADIVRLMSAADTRALPVRENDKIVGVVRAKDIIHELREFYRNVRIIDVMTRKPVSCSSNDALGSVIARMVQRGVDRMPVVDKSGKLVGIVSFVDILADLMVFPQKKMRVPRAASHNEWRVTGFGVGEKQNLLKCPVENVMTGICHNCSVGNKMADVIDIMGEHDVSSVIIVDAEKPVGIITLKDVFEFYRKRK
ncbi:CBS domain-containing protein [Candidatus Woesearchaeota archaeon]|nr:CBS domain-containing protein [Candidatus Woesearchaeota archaeon]